MREVEKPGRRVYGINYKRRQRSQPRKEQIRSMSRRIRNTRKTKNTRKPTTVRNESGSEKGKKSEDDWGPVSSAAKKVAKGAVKGAAREILK